MKQVFEQKAGTIQFPGARIYDSLSLDKLISIATETGEGTLTDTCALSLDTGEFTGRSPKDRYIVEDDLSLNHVNWGEVNIPISQDCFNGIYQKMISYFNGKELYTRSLSACADPEYSLGLRIFSEKAYLDIFASNLFLPPTGESQEEWQIIAAPGFMADPEKDGTRAANFSIISFEQKVILIGGTGYAGEVKKAVFSVLNFILPLQRDVLSMHCSANVGKDGDTAIFFGLSGTGKTTLSADPKRSLVGDDEHGWSAKGIFNFEGGCYAKCVNLSPEKEPQIHAAIKKGAVLENVRFFPGTNKVDYSDISVTENTRAAYPLAHISGALIPSMAGIPENIFFLSADAFGVLPPISLLNHEQARYYFQLGYTAKLAGTETGVKDPTAVFSACFGKAFLPLAPGYYAQMLGDKLEKYGSKVWLINTGWCGGAFGKGQRIPLEYTRSMITAVLDGSLADQSFNTHSVFGLQMPKSCPGVPDHFLNPELCWDDKEAYLNQARALAALFEQQYALLSPA